MRNLPTRLHQVERLSLYALRLRAAHPERSEAQSKERRAPLRVRRTMANPAICLVVVEDRSPADPFNLRWGGNGWGEGEVSDGSL
jgi:hypothetical protein